MPNKINLQCLAPIRSFQEYKEAELDPNEKKKQPKTDTNVGNSRERNWVVITAFHMFEKLSRKRHKKHSNQTYEDENYRVRWKITIWD